MSNENTSNKVESKNKTPQINHKHLLKKQLTYSCGMKLDDDNNSNNKNYNKLHRSQEVENLTEKQEQESELLNQDITASNFKTNLKRTVEHENLNTNETNND